jgi:hypothetical protein
MDTFYTMPETPNHFLVFKEKEKELLKLKNYQVQSGSEEWHRVPTDRFPSFLKNSISALKQSGTKYLIATPKD